MIYLKKYIKKISYIIIGIIIFYIFSLKSNTQNSYDLVIQKIILFLVLFVSYIFLTQEKISQKFKIIILLIAIGLFVSYPVFNNYLVWQHDSLFHIYRIENIAEGLRNFQFPIRIHSLANNGYGFPTSMLYPELFLYIPAILRLLGTSTIFTFKLLTIFINILSAFSMYLAVKNISKSTTSGILGAIIYASANYRLETIFTRGAIGESLALAFFPIAIWGLYEVLSGDKKKWYILLIGITGILQSHIISILFLSIICIIFGIYYIKEIFKQKRYIQLLLTFIILVLLNIWFIVPFIETMQLDLNVKYFKRNIF